MANGSNGIDEAASAFDAEISSERPTLPTRSSSKGEERSGTDITDVFPNMSTREVDDESPAKGGGDEEVDEEDVLYGADPEEGDGDLDLEEPDDEQDAEEGDEEPEEDEDVDDEVLGAKHLITVDGEEQEVTTKEALEGYIRTKTFHKRLTELGENQQILQRASAEVVQNYEYVQQMAELMEEQMNQLVPPEPNWDEMFKTDANKARNLQKYYQQVADFKKGLQEKRTEAAKKLEEHERVQLATYAQQESLRFNRLNQKNWGTDPKKKLKDIRSMRRTAMAEGFAEEEVNQVFDSRMLQILLKASKYDRIIAARPKPVQRKVAGKTVTPGSGNKRTGRKGLTVAMKNLAKSGSIHDAAPVFDEILRQR
jgi:hypothetical protein